MVLPTDLISQIVKVTNDSKPTNEETTVYGTIRIGDGGTPYVMLDGSDLLTPITTTAVVKDGDRVTVMIKNHTAIVTGNVTAPSAQGKDVDEAIKAVDKIAEFEIIVAYRVTTDELNAINATIDNLKARIANFGDITALNAEIEKLRSEYAELDYVYAKDVEALNAHIENIKATFGDFADVSTEELEAANAEIENLRAYNADFTYVSADVLKAMKAKIDTLDVTSLDAKYANIDFSNIGEAAIERFFSQSGLIEDVVVGDGTITGTLVGVTIKGDLIEGNTVVADKLVIKGTDGLYYKLNTDGVTTEAEQTAYNSLDGSIITAKSITASKIAVTDLVAFGATIGGFNITGNSIYSGVKESVGNMTRGIYLDTDGQIAIGDATSYLRYYRDQNGAYKLAISADSIVFTTDSAAMTVSDFADSTLVDVIEEFYQSDSHSTLSSGSWSSTQPAWTDGTYIWQRTKLVYGDGSNKYTPSETGVCITGNTGSKGDKGEDSILLMIESSNGNIFKNTGVATTLTVNVIVGDHRITSYRQLQDRFGSEAYLQWSVKRQGETEFEELPADDPRISDNGFILTLNPNDVNVKTVFDCSLNY